MADFNNPVQGVSGSPVQPQGGVVDNSTAQTISNVSGILGNVGQLFAGISQSSAAKQKQQQQTLADSVVSGYAQRTTALNAAVEQGKITWAEAKMKQRALYNQTVANHPSLTESLTKFQGDLNATAGLGDVLAKGTAVDQQIQDDTKKATAAGFVSPSMTPQEQDVGLQRYKQMEHNLYNMNYQKNQLGLQAAQLEIVSKRESIAASRANRANAQLDIEMKRNKVSLQNSIADVANTYRGKIQTDLGQIQAAVDNKQMTPEQALAATNQIKNNFAAQLQPVRGAGDPNFIDNLTKPIFDMVDRQNDFLSGKISKDTYQAQVDSLTAMASLDALKDPVLAAGAAYSKMFPQLSPAILSQIGNVAVAHLNKSLGNGTPPNLIDNDTKADNKAYLKSVGEMSTRIKEKDPTVMDSKGTLQEMNLHVNSILKGINAYSMAVESPAQLNDVTNFMASKDFINFQKAGGQVNASNAAAVKSIIGEQYNNAVIPAISKEWDNSKTMTASAPRATAVNLSGEQVAGNPTKTKTPQAVDYRWTGSSLTFVPAKGMERNRGAVAKARDLNQRVSPLVNKLVRMSAHLDGNEDYAKYFKDFEPAMFGVQPEEQQGTGE